MKTDLQVIEGALALIEADGGWTQRAYCRDANGGEVQPAVGSSGEWLRVRTDPVGEGGYRARTEPGATPYSFCLEGALRAAAGYWHVGQASAAHEQIDRLENLLLRLANSASAPGWPSVRAYNDDVHTTKSDVALTLKRAAVQLEGQEQL